MELNASMSGGPVPARTSVTPKDPGERHFEDCLEFLPLIIDVEVARRICERLGLALPRLCLDTEPCDPDDDIEPEQPLPRTKARDRKYDSRMKLRRRRLQLS
jgi:hypothetical protein